jgi:sarcosine oxidase
MPAGRVDLVVVGLGAMGAAVAWRAARRGLRVAGFDARHPPHTEGSTHGHSRIIREAYFEHPQYVPLVQQAYTLWAELEAAARVRLFHATGGLMVGAPDGVVVSGTLRAASTHGLTVQTWTSDEIRQRVPALRPDAGMVGVFEPRAGVLAPEKAVSAMLALATSLGARVSMNEPVLEWEAAAETVTVRTARTELRSTAVVLAAGPWMPLVARAVAPPLAIERQVQYWYPTAGDSRFAPGTLPVFLVEGSDGQTLYGLPDQGRGVKLAQHHGGRLVSVETVDRRVGDDERSRFHALASRWIGGLPPAPAEATVCLYSNTPDGDFVLGAHTGTPNVYVCSACSGHGFKFAPAIGEAMVTELVDGAADDRLAPFRPSRFEGR